MNQPTAIGRKLGELGYRLTPQRIMILRAVEETDGHISAEEIYAQICAHYPQMNISTVYRTMELLKGKGHHHHLVCEKCGETIDIEESILNPLWAEIREKYGFRVNMKHLAFFGLCPKCRK